MEMIVFQIIFKRRLGKLSQNVKKVNVDIQNPDHPPDEQQQFLLNLSMKFQRISMHPLSVVSQRIE